MTVTMTALIGLTILATPALGDINASFHLGGGIITNYAYAHGWWFTPTTDITLTRLGLWDEDQDGLAQGHDVGIFEVANPSVALATAFIDSSDPLSGDSRFEAVDSVVLSAGTAYYLLANNFMIDRYVYGSGNVGFAPEINWLGYSYSLTSNSIFCYPIHAQGLPGDLGPNFQYIPVVSPCPEDINGDGFVDVQDLLMLLSAWGNAGGPEDINGDEVVDVQDLLMLLSAWGPCA
jgi:hypothetical protein